MIAWRNLYGPVFVFAVLAFASAFALHRYQPCTVSGISMEPTLYSGEHFFLDKKAFDATHLPRRGDFIVFEKNKSDALVLKRVIGIPGDKIRVEGRDIAINNVPLGRQPVKSADDAYNEFEQVLPDRAEFHIFEGKKPLLDRPSSTGETIYEVPAGQYFVAGDNRDNAHDSRNGLGYVSFEDIRGKPVLFFPSEF